VEQVVVSVTSFETATKAHNVIPEKVKMRGTVRTLSPAIRDLAEERMKQIVEGTAATFGATAELNYKRNYPVTVNAEENTEFAAEAARKVAGDCDTNAPLVMGGEDFAFMLEERPGAYILVGTGRARRSTTRNTISTTRPSRRAVRGGPRSWSRGCPPPERACSR
jgi:metal-dependent amidase/aminoacylase/carboxypeptidase family protein